MKTKNVNFAIDLVAFLLLLGMIFTGVIIKYVLVPCESREAAGEMAGAAIPELAAGGPSTIFSWGRHDWGWLHFWLSVGFSTAMALHLFQHWRWLWGIVAGGRTAPRRAARGIGALAVGLGLVLATVGIPFLLPTQQVPPPAFEASAIGLRTDDASANNEKTENSEAESGDSKTH